MTDNVRIAVVMNSGSLSAGKPHMVSIRTRDRGPLRRQLCVWAGHTEVVGELNPTVKHLER